MKKLILLLTLICSHLYAQDGFKRSYKLSNFNAIDVGGSFEVRVKQASEYSVKVLAEKKKDLEDLEVSVSHGELNIGFNNNWNFWDNITGSRGKVKIYITMPDIESLDLSGASQLSLYPFKGLHDLNVDVSGAAKAKIAVETEELNVDASGASHIEIKGRIEKMNVDLSGASHLKAKEAIVGRANVEASGASHASFGKVKDLDSDTSGASHVSRD